LTGLLATADIASVVGGLARLVHDAGVPVTPERSGRFAATIDLARPATVDELYWLGRITLVSTYGEIDIFDRVFGQVFRGIWDPADFRGYSNTPPPISARRGPSPQSQRGDDRPGRPSTEPAPSSPGDNDHGSDEDDTAESVLAAMSTEERLRAQEFASMTEAELAELRALMSRLALAPPPRRSRRTVRHRSGSAIDLRATMQRSLRTSGDPVELVRRRRRTRLRKLVVLCDISGSMEPYARAYLQLLCSAVGGANAEAFVFATRLTRITKVLHDTNPNTALLRAGHSAPDWAGGTRIGQAVKAFNDRYGRRGMARNAIVVIVSDGWERDDPRLLGIEMERLGRLAHKVIWVNPRKAAHRYEPTVGGMAAALPHVDAFVSGHTLAAIDELLAEIASG
jgi:uncharacterized protein with von Willebrand factor type A (vWA) domain